VKRRRAIFKADGVLVIDKSSGPTSHDVVERLRRRFKPGKLGHTGTLDPMATGVLVLAFNQTTRLSNLLGAGRKIYRGRLALGAATDTGDRQGEVIEQAAVPELSREVVEKALTDMVGPRQQKPPAYSAAKHQGRPLYAYARQGVKVDKPAKDIVIYQATLLGMDPEGLDLEITCSRGTYVRSLGEELAVQLGTVGHLESLCREESRPFTRQEALQLQQALDMEPEELAAAMIDPSSALARCGLPASRLDADRSWQIQHGRLLPPAVFLADADPGLDLAESFRVLNQEGDLIAVLRWLPPESRRSGKSYETIRVFPSGGSQEHEESRAGLAALGAE
jgi:tRNA pseudouridine55 synthase